MLTEDLQLNTGLLDTFLPLIQAHYLDFISHFEMDPVEALQTACAPFTQPEDYSWCIYVREQMVERYGTAEQLEEYRHQLAITRYTVRSLGICTPSGCFSNSA